MIIGIIGAGGIGQALAAHMANAGYEVIVSNSRGPESLAGLVSELGPHAKAGTRQEALRGTWWCCPSRGSKCTRRCLTCLRGTVAS